MKVTGSLRPPKTDKLNLMYEKSKCVEFGFALGHRFVAVELPREDARVLVPLADGKAAAASGQRADFA